MTEKIKFFHELTKEEYGKLVESKMTYGELAEKYPQPDWCSYPEAVYGEMGCWSLISFKVTGKDYCEGCECLIRDAKEATK